MKKYILFECGECGLLIAYPSRTADGNICCKCNGYIIPKNDGTKKELMEIYGDKIVYPLSKNFEF